MVVLGLRPHAPLVDHAAAPLGPHPVLGGELLRQEPVRPGIASKERNASAVAHWNRQPGMDEALPEVRVEHRVPDRALSLDVRDAPVEPQAVAAPRALPSERLGVPPTTPDVDAKVKAAEDAAAPKPAAQDAPGAARPTEASKDAGARAGRATGDPGAKGGQPVAKGGKATCLREDTHRQMSLVDAAVSILSQGSGDPMGCKDLVAEAVNRGLWAPRTGKTPASTLYAAILREIAAKGDKSRFVKTERGRFALMDSVYARELAAKDRQP